METLTSIIWYLLSLLGSGLGWVFGYILDYLLTVPRFLIGLFALYSSVYYIVAWYKHGLAWGWYHAAILYWNNTKKLYPWLWNTGRKVYYHLRAIGAIELSEETAAKKPQPPKEIVRYVRKPIGARFKGWVALILFGVVLDRVVVHWTVLAPLFWG